MERHPELEQAQRLPVKTVGQVFVARASEDLGSSLLEADSLTEPIKC